MPLFEVTNSASFARRLIVFGALLVLAAAIVDHFARPVAEDPDESVQPSTAAAVEDSND